MQTPWNMVPESFVRLIEFMHWRLSALNMLASVRVRNCVKTKVPSPLGLCKVLQTPPIPLWAQTLVWHTGPVLELHSFLWRGMLGCNQVKIQHSTYRLARIWPRLVICFLHRSDSNYVPRDTLKVSIIMFHNVTCWPHGGYVGVIILCLAIRRSVFSINRWVSSVNVCRHRYPAW